MSDDVLITPASRKVEFFDSGGNIDGKIELDASGNLNITSTGSIGIGDITQDIHIGDGTQAVDLVFDFTSSIYSVANQDLTIGKGSLGGNDITIDSASAVILSLAGTEQARLTSTGLGIGTTSPDTALEIMNGTLKITREETEDSVVTEDDVSLNVAGGLRWTFSKSFDDPNPVPIGTTTDNDVRIIRYNQTHTYWYWDRTYFSKKVGIGTTTIDAPLHVESGSDLLSIFESTDANAGIRIDSPDDGYSVVFFAEGGTDKWSLGKLANNSDKFSIYDEVNNTARFVIDTDGDIGIGTMSPAAKLEIQQTDGAVHGLKVYRNDASTSTSLVYLVDDSIYVDNPTLHVKNDRTDEFGYAAVFEGMVGIGTTTPSTELHVSGASHPSIRVTGTDNAGADPAIELLGTADDFTEGGQLWYDNGTGVLHLASIYNNAAADIQFHTRTGADRSTSNVRMTIAGGGNVGIGQTDPQYTLDVSGSIFLGNSSETTSLTGSSHLQIQGDTAIATFKADNAGSGDQIAGIRVFADSYRSAGMVIGDYNNTDGSTTEDWLIGRGYASTNKVGISATPENGGDEYITAVNETQKKVIIAADNDDIDFQIKGTSNTYFHADAANERIGIGVTAPLSTLDIGASGVLTFGNIRTQLKITNSSADLQLGHADNVHVLIDTFNNATDNYFSVRKNNTTASSATELFRVNENGKIRFNDAYEFPASAGSTGDILTLDGTDATWTTQDRITKPAVFMDTGTQNITQLATTVGFNSEILDGGNNAALSGVNDGHILLTAAGYYRVSYSIPINEVNNTGDARNRVFAVMETDDNDAFSSPTTVAQSRAQVYTREDSGGSGLSASFIFEHTAEEYIRLRLQQSSTYNTNISTESNQSQISIDYLGPA